MSETNNQPVSTENTDDEPIYYNPGRLSLISGIASWTSWFVLVFFILDTIFEGYVLSTKLGQMSQQGTSIFTLISSPTTGFYTYLYSTVFLPLFTGVVFFLLLQAASIGLNVVLELDFNAREGKGNK
jgi:hypothetical protein